MPAYLRLLWLALFGIASALTASLYLQHRSIQQEIAKLIFLQDEYRTYIASIKQYDDAERACNNNAELEILNEEEEKKKPFLVVDRSKKYLRESLVNYFEEKNLGHKLKELDALEKRRVVSPVVISRAKKRIATAKSMPRYRFDQSKKFKWPLALKEFWISSFFGKRKNRNGTVGFHFGIDMAALKGTKVSAADDGKVIDSAYYSGYGNMVLILHNNKYKTRYAHLDKLLVKKGDIVKSGQIIGTVGDTGYVRSSGRDASHLHFEVWAFDKAINPLYVLPW